MSERPTARSGLLPGRGDLPPTGSAVHLMGIGGAGMRGVALLLAEDGYRVSGCDRAGPVEAPELAEREVVLHEGHDTAHVGAPDGVAPSSGGSPDDGTRPALLVRSSAVPENHAEVRAARERDVPVWKRSRALAALVNDTRLVGVSGAHGKTTITAMAARACEAAGLDPTGVVGGQVPGWGGNARSGAGGLSVVEADEYDRSFLQLDPDLVVLSSVEEEHLDTYGDMASLRQAYRAFAERAVGRLGVLYCADDAGARALGSALPHACGYGFDADAEYRVASLGAGEGVERGRLTTPDAALDFELGAPGEHNLQNAAAALGVALALGAEPARLGDALRDFRGVDRRMQRLADHGGTAVIDDYAHHPTEVRAAIAAARRLYPDRRLVAVFQPHLFSRTRRFPAEFAAALAAADRALVLPIYPAREDPIPGVTSELILRAAGEGAGGPGEGAASGAPGALELVEPGELAGRVADAAGGEPAALLFMGAGNVTRMAHEAAGEVMDRARDA